jgi:flagellar hook-associated protein 1 FlgK
LSGLFGTLDVALHSLLTQQGALRATTDNIGNINTPGYARRRPVITEEDPAFRSGVLIGRGATLTSIESIRDRVLELRISTEQQRQSSTDTFVSSMSGVEVLFTDGDDSLGGRIQSFFNSLDRLSTSPSDVSLRQAVLTSAGNVAQSFNDMAVKLHSERDQIDLNVVQIADEVNRLSESIAKINQAVVAKEAMGEEPGPLEDQRTELLKQLSSKIDVNVTDTPDGWTISTVRGNPLVVAGNSYQLTTALDATSHTTQIVAGTDDITADITGGELGGLLRARDRDISSLSTSLDQFASSFGSALNAAHNAGFDSKGVAGVDLFTLTGTPMGAAGSMRLNITDPQTLATSSAPGQADNGNLLNMLSARDTGIVNGETPGDAYSSMVFQVGGDIANAKIDSQAGEVVLQQLNELRGSISGVSLDEEAANLIRFQRAFEASARIIQAVNEMLNTAVQLGSQ